MPLPDYTALELRPPPAHRPYVLLNMVMSADGKVVVEGTEQGIGSRADQRLMRELRVNADVVLNGAGTLRVSGTSSRLNAPDLEQLRLERGKPRFPVAATVSRSGNLPLDRAFFTARDFDAVVYLSALASEPRRAAIAATGRPVVVLPPGDEIAAMLSHMRSDLGAAVLLLEGGPDLNADFFALDAVDEFFLTLGPRIIAGRDSLTAVEGPAPFSRETMRQLQLLTAVPNEQTSEVYLHYRVRH
ncbi:MAG: dihydrofolate reductase family protein [Dehalococcoidia bacterium]|nr:dihydrofolate reductase family protein [Dehalococcoidia bacterium]